MSDGWLGAVKLDIEQKGTVELKDAKACGEVLKDVEKKAENSELELVMVSVKKKIHASAHAHTYIHTYLFPE